MKSCPPIGGCKRDGELRVCSQVEKKDSESVQSVARNNQVVVVVVVVVVVLLLLLLLVVVVVVLVVLLLLLITMMLMNMELRMLVVFVELLMVLCGCASFRSVQ